jgi:hypothetical protein
MSPTMTFMARLNLLLYGLARHATEYLNLIGRFSPITHQCLLTQFHALTYLRFHSTPLAAAVIDLVNQLASLPNTNTVHAGGKHYIIFNRVSNDYVCVPIEITSTNTTTLCKVNLLHCG